ncbi:MAG: GNAT family N-acetyltransferase [Beijerinckiaceae bacterium]
MIHILDEYASDLDAREALLDAAFGDERFAKTSEKLRTCRKPAKGLALVAKDDDGRLVGTVRLWHVMIGNRPALMLGPLAVDARLRGAGIGGALMREAIARAKLLGHDAIILVGDADYYARFGFSNALTGMLWLPGPVDRARFLALELKRDALKGAAGILRPTGERTRKSAAGKSSRGMDRRRALTRAA